MMMKTAGGPGTVQPFDFNDRKKPMPRWMWGMIGVSALLHVGAGVWLYNQNFTTGDSPLPQEDKDTIKIELFRPKPPEPEVVKDPPPPAANTRFNETPAPTTQTETVSVAQADDPAPSGDTITVTRPVADPEPGAGAATNVETTPAPDPVIRNPQWVRRPSGEQLMRAYPDRALNANVSGSATLSCGVRADGTMTGCTVVSESPGNYGFGRAAMSLSRDFRISPRTVDGRPVEGSRVTIPIRFNAPPER